MKLPCLLVLLAALSVQSPAQTPGYHTTGSIEIGGTGGWDYLAADGPGHRLYVSHTSQVEVIDLQSRKPAGQISGMTRIHGIAVANALGLGFISDGGANQIVEFRLKDLSVLKKIQAGTNPDGIVYDDFSKRVFAFNGSSKDATVVDAASGAVAKTVPLGGKPEFPVSDGAGSVFVNIEDTSEIVKVDSQSLTVAARWPLAPCESPSGLAIDKAGSRLFAVCENKMMAIVDATSGKVVATPPIGEGPDAAAYDPGAKLAFSSNGGSGTLTVIRQTGKDQYAVAETVETVKGARTMTLDPSTHTIYLSTASFAPAQPAAAGSPRRRPSILPGTFKILVVAPAS
jgi:DNA-binding beta-propeller fold protein YncE